MTFLFAHNVYDTIPISVMLCINDLLSKYPEIKVQSLRIRSVYQRSEMAVQPRGAHSSYDRLRARHKQAYSYLSKALQIDEAGVGESERATVNIRA